MEKKTEFLEKVMRDYLGTYHPHIGTVPKKKSGKNQCLKFSFRALFWKDSALKLLGIILNHHSMLEKNELLSIKVVRKSVFIFCKGISRRNFIKRVTKYRFFPSNL